MENRCKRCNRELSDPNADYGWRCAQILGVSNQLSKMRPEAFERFLSGISKADKLMGNADFNSEQKNGMYKSYAKMALWDGIDKNKVAEAKKDSFAAAGGRKSNTNLAEELSEYEDRSLPQWAKDAILKYKSMYNSAKNQNERVEAQKSAEQVRNFVSKYYKEKSVWDENFTTDGMNKITKDRSEYYNKLTFHHTN